MSSGLMNKKRDFQMSEEMQWHKETELGKPYRDRFPLIVALPLTLPNGTPAKFGDREFVIPVNEIDGLPVAPPYCKGSYSLFQPREAWDWAHKVLEGTGFAVKSIGMLWDNSFWFLGIHLRELESMVLGDGRNCEMYLNASGGLDRSVSPQMELSGILPVCWNTISLSRMLGEVLYKHKATKNFGVALENSTAEIEKAVGMAAVFKAAMSKLADKPCKVERAERIFAGYLTPEADNEMSKRTRNTVEVLKGLHVTGKGNRGETEFDALNAYTELLSVGTDDSKVEPAKRWVSGEFGGNADSKADFCNLLVNRKTRVGDSEVSLAEIEKRGKELLVG